jgi:hypothetical protein
MRHRVGFCNHAGASALCFSARVRDGRGLLIAAEGDRFDSSYLRCGVQQKTPLNATVSALSARDEWRSQFRQTHRETRVSQPAP